MAPGHAVTDDRVSDKMDLLAQHYRHWPEDHAVVGNLLRRTRLDFRAAGVVSHNMLDVALDMLRHFFFLESTVLADRRSQRLPWQDITKLLQEAFPESKLASYDLVAATKAVTERKKSVLRSLGSEGTERERLAFFFPAKEFEHVRENRCVTDAMLAKFLDSLLPSMDAPPPENRPAVARSPITAPAAVRSPIAPRRQNGARTPTPTSPPPPARTPPSAPIVANTPPRVQLTPPRAVIAVEAPLVQPPAPPLALPANEVAEAEPGTEAEANAEPGVEAEADVNAVIADEGDVDVPIADSDDDVRIGRDAVDILEERQLRLEEAAAAETAGDGLEDSDELFEKLIADELSATTAKGKSKVRLKRLGADPSLLSYRFEARELLDLAAVKAFFQNAENVQILENRISVSRRLNAKAETALISYFRGIFAALVCEKLPLDVVYSLLETLVGAFAFLARPVRSVREAQSNKATTRRWNAYLAQHKSATLLEEYKFIMEAESARQRTGHARRAAADKPPPDQKAVTRRLAAKTAHTSNGLQKAVAILTSDGTAPGTEETLAKLIEKTPAAEKEFSAEAREIVAVEGAEAKNRVFFRPSTLSTAILACANNSSSDIAGVCFEHIKSLLGRANSGGRNHFLSFLCFLLEEVARDPKGKCFKAMTAAKYIAISKPKSDVPGDIRPIGITSVLRRIYGKYVMFESGKIIGNVLSSRERNPQFAVGVPSGANILGIESNIRREVAPADVCVAIDISNAFNMVDRSFLFKALSRFRENFKHKELRFYDNFMSYARAHYAHGPQDLSFFMADGERKSVKCSRGVNQGCPHGTALFSIVLDEVVCGIFEVEESSVRLGFQPHHRFPTVFSNWFADDGVVSGPLDEVKAFVTTLAQVLRLKAGLKLKFATCLGGVETDPETLNFANRGQAMGVKWKFLKWSPGDSDCGITVAGTPVGTAAYVRKAALDIAQKHQHRLNCIADFAENGQDGPRDFGKDFTTVGTRHLALTLLDYCCQRRFDYVTHIISKDVLGAGLIEHVQKSIHSCFSRICGGEIQVPLLDEVGKQLLALPLKHGGQAIHDIGFEADISLVSTLYALSRDIVKRLPEHHRNHFAKAVKTASSDNTYDIFADKTFSWTKAMVDACNRTNVLLRASQIEAISADPSTVLVDKSSPHWKRKTLEKLYEVKAAAFQHRLEAHAKKEQRRGNTVPAALFKIHLCSIQSQNIWRDWRAVALSQNHMDVKKFYAPNLVRDSSLPPLLRWKLLQPLVGGPGIGDLPPDELFGWEVLLEKARPGPSNAVRGPSKKHRHNEIASRVGIIGANAMKQTLIKEHSREMDAWKLADPEAANDIHHSPDYAFVDAFGKATLVDFSVTRPITKQRDCIIPHDNHLDEAEKRKRTSHWRHVREQFGGLASFEPHVMDWDGAFAVTFQKSLESWAQCEIDRCVGVARLRLDKNPNARQQMVGAKVRDYKAQIQTHSLDLIGQALHFSRLSIAACGKVKKTRRLDVAWQEVNVESICPPPSGGFHLFDGERDAAIPVDSVITESAVLVPRQVVGGPAQNTRSASRRSREAISQLPERVNDSNEIDLDEFGSPAESEDDDGVMHGDNVLENIDPHDMFEPRLHRRIPAMVPVEPHSVNSSFFSVSENLDSDEDTPQSCTSHSERTPEVAMYCGAPQFE